MKKISYERRAYEYVDDRSLYSNFKIWREKGSKQQWVKQGKI